MISRYNSSQAAQIMVEAVPDHLVDQYGIVDVNIAQMKVKVLLCRVLLKSLQ